MKEDLDMRRQEELALRDAALRSVESERDALLQQLSDATQQLQEARDLAAKIPEMQNEVAFVTHARQSIEQEVNDLRKELVVADREKSNADDRLSNIAREMDRMRREWDEDARKNKALLSDIKEDNAKLAKQLADERTASSLAESQAEKERCRANEEQDARRDAEAQVASSNGLLAEQKAAAEVAADVVLS